MIYDSMIGKLLRESKFEIDYIFIQFLKDLNFIVV
jgi:hypothetical protein